jgi:predicted SprT family Zn-dependent metalloprotease
MAARTAGLYRERGGRHEIVLSERYLELATGAQRDDLIRHELAHYHLARLGFPRAGHGPRFRQLMQAWRFSRFPDARILQLIAAKQESLRHLYLCPSGHEHWLRRHPRRRAVSCGLCSPAFDGRYRLRYSGVSRRGPAGA